MQKEIEEFRQRILLDSDFCLELFDYATTRLLAFKYAYYVLSEQIVKDMTYDLEEKSWYVMGRALNLLQEHETSPCIDWNPDHPLAGKGIALANKLLYGPIIDEVGETAPTLATPTVIPLPEPIYQHTVTYIQYLT